MNREFISEPISKDVRTHCMRASHSLLMLCLMLIPCSCDSGSSSRVSEVNTAPSAPSNDDPGKRESIDDVVARKRTERAAEIAVEAERLESVDKLDEAIEQWKQAVAMDSRHKPRQEKAQALANKRDEPERIYKASLAAIEGATTLEAAQAARERYTGTDSNHLARLDSALRSWYWRKAKEIRKFNGHTDMLFSVAFDWISTSVLSASADKTARLWDAQTGKETRKFEGHTEPVYSAVLSPDGELVLTASGEKTVRLWDAATGKEIRKFESDTVLGFSAAFSPDGQQVLTGCSDGTMRLWGHPPK